MTVCNRKVTAFTRVVQPFGLLSHASVAQLQFCEIGERKYVYSVWVTTILATEAQIVGFNMRVCSKNARIDMRVRSLRVYMTICSMID